MEFEYDPEKSKKNKEKHGIDFEEAKVILGGGHSGKTGEKRNRTTIYGHRKNA